jgi:hypothetical protein
MTSIRDKSGDTPVTAKEAELYAVRTVSALAKMPAEDRSGVLDAVPDTVREAAELVSKDLRETEPELSPRPEVLEARIERALAENDDRSRLDDTFKTGVGVRETLLTATTEEDWRQAVLKGAARLREIFAESGVPKEQIDALVLKLELLQDLHGRRDLSQVNDRSVKEAIAMLSELDLASLVQSAGEDLGTVLFKPLEETAKKEDAI